MNKNYKMLTLGILLFSLTLLGCKKDLEHVSKTNTNSISKRLNTEGISFENGMLVFDSQDHFDNTLDLLYNESIRYMQENPLTQLQN